MNLEKVDRPTPVINKTQAIANIVKMQQLAERDKVHFRPHFKTHQSLEVAEWFSDLGVDCCAVSSPEMACLFAGGGWRDILIAIPATANAAYTYNRLAAEIKLGVIGDSLALINDLEESLTENVDFWIEVDAGYGRTGVKWDNEVQIQSLVKTLRSCQKLKLRGLLVHAGDSYACSSNSETLALAELVKQRVLRAKKIAGEALEVTYGDTPTCSLGADMTAYDEMRPGNFVFYDLTQQQIGSCQHDEISLTIACPVIGVYPERGEVVIHGGAVHLSKDTLTDDEGTHFGIAYSNLDIATQRCLGRVVKISQEHGTIKGDVAQLSVGDVVYIYPVHSCLVVDCLKDSPAYPE